MRKRVLRLFSLLTTLSLLAPTLAMAGEPFAAGWEAKPLVDSAPSGGVTPAEPVPSSNAAPTAQPPAPRLEEVLKPAVPFIESVEAKLYLAPRKDELLATRLNRIQTVLFGEVKYQDAGELLAKMAELFPQEAAKARADLLAQMKNSMPPQPAQSKPAAQPSPSPQTAMNAPIQTYPPADPKALKKKKDSFWGDDDDFFSDDDWDREFSHSQASSGSRGSGLANLGAGLASLATIAGSLAGSYYLNKNLGGSYTYRDPYGSPYYYNGYGAPYGMPYGYYPGYGSYGSGYATPYSTRIPPYVPYQGYKYYNPRSYYGVPGSATYGRTGISGLGVPY